MKHWSVTVWISNRVQSGLWRAYSKRRFPSACQRLSVWVLFLCGGEKNTDVASVILVCPTQSVVGWYAVSPHRMCLSTHLGFVVVLSRPCVAMSLPLHTTHVEQMHKENGAFPHGCFCRTHNRSSGLAGSPSFCPCPNLPTCHVKHRVLTPSFRDQLASAPSSFLLCFFLYFSEGKNRMGVLFQSFPKCDVKIWSTQQATDSCDHFYVVSYYLSVTFSSPLLIFVINAFLFILFWLDPHRDTGCLWCVSVKVSSTSILSKAAVFLGEDFFKLSQHRCLCYNCTTERQRRNWDIAEYGKIHLKIKKPGQNKLQHFCNSVQNTVGLDFANFLHSQQFSPTHTTHLQHICTSPHPLSPNH